MPATIDVILDESIGVINPNLYGHFVEQLGGCVEGGIWARGSLCAEVVEALRRVRPPVIRWPGGCFADDYHWRDGVGPREQRPRTVNIHWGNVVEDNAFGTHEFIEFCRAVGAKPYLAGNVGSGSPRELRDWVEYCNFPGGSTLSNLRGTHGHPAPMRVGYWGVGNEPWGCGGNFTPETYADLYRQYATYLRDFGDCPLFLIAPGPDGNCQDWTRRFFEQMKRGRRPRIHGYAAHYYCGTAGAGSATDFGEGEWYELLRKAMLMEELVVQQRALMDEYDPGRGIALIVDEWGTWHFPAPGRNPAFLWQQNTLRDALIAATTLDIFNRHADKVAMANIAQAVNVLQALLLVDDGKVTRTPTYHVFDLYQNHQGGRSVRVEIAAPSVTFNFDDRMQRLPGLTGSASLTARTLTLTVVHPRLGEPIDALIRLRGGSAAIVRETVLTHPDMTAHNDPASPREVQLTEPRVIAASGEEFSYRFSGQSVTRLEMSIV